VIARALSRRRCFPVVGASELSWDLERIVRIVSRARALADRYWAFYRETAQLWNIDRGDVDEIERWEDLSGSGVAERVRGLGDFGGQAERSLSVDSDVEDVSLLAAVSYSAAATALVLPWMRSRGLVSGPFNFATFLLVLVPGYSLVTRRHGDGYIAKLNGVPSFIDGWVDGLREGLAAGQKATARGVADVIAEFDRLLGTEVFDDPLAGQNPPSELTASEVDAWRDEVITAIGGSVRPAVARLRDVLQLELLPGASSDEEPGLCHLPGGAEAYEDLLWAATSSALGSDAIHQLGRAQLARLDDEYGQIAGPTLGVDDPALMRDRLRSDPSLQYTSTDEIIGDVHAMLDRARSEAPRWFSRLPRAECDTVAVNAGGMAYYTAPSPDGSRNGTFYFDATDPRRWTRFALAPTTFHEAIPGHHLQLALPLELDLHPVLGELEVTAYSEGWGLYAERLADEMGLYATPLQHIGMLTLDSLRAGRLVVDTGIHAKGWSRQRAIDFLYDHTALSRRNVEAEIDRYIADPGQAASYMVGRLEIDRLRAEAATRLGNRFSIQGFHDTILHGGMTPLNELARRINAWIATSPT
jgi:uncharacterized protein (DUF885 family)